MLRIVIADDHPLFRMGLKYALSAQGFEVVAEAEDGHAAIEVCRRIKPDVVLLDVKMPKLDGLEVCRIVKDLRPETLIVMLTTFDEPAIVSAAKRAGASAFLSKETEAGALARLLPEIYKNPERDWLPKVEVPRLTSRESEVLGLLAQGRTNKAIAKQLGVSPETVKDHLTGIYRKLEVKDRLSAVREARQLGLLRLEGV